MDTKKKTKTSYNLSAEAKDVLSQLAHKFAVSQTAMLEMIIRERGRQEGVWDTEAADEQQK